jgi:hypothetical protein
MVSRLHRSKPNLNTADGLCGIRDLRQASCGALDRASRRESSGLTTGSRLPRSSHETSTTASCASVDQIRDGAGIPHLAENKPSDLSPTIEQGTGTAWHWGELHAPDLQRPRHPPACRDLCGHSVLGRARDDVEVRST